jgi:GT2 family glycosyltransferase
MRTSRSCVLVLNWNGPGITRACLRSLAEAKVAAQDVLLVDNGSTDGSPEALAREFPDVRQLVLPRNAGYTGGNNAGFRLLLEEDRYRYALVLNNDATVAPGMLERLERALDDDARCGMAQPKVLWPDGTVENAGYAMDRYGMTLPRGRGAPGDAAFPSEGWFYASGACVLVRLETLREVGGFDEAYFGYHEDVDLAWRMRLAGWRLAYCDDVVCRHDESTTAGRSPKKIGVIWRNRYRTLLKDYGAARAWLRLPAAVMLTTVVALGVSVKERDPAYVGMHARALAWNARRLPDTLRERRRVQATRRAPDRAVCAAMRRRSVEMDLILRRKGA